MLSDVERAVVAAAADALFPPGQPLGRSGREAGAVEYLEAYFGRAQGRSLRLMRLMLWSVELAPLLFGPRRRRFTRLSPAEQVRFLELSSRSEVYLRRVTFITLRVLLTMAYLSDAHVIRALGIVSDPDPFSLDGDAKEPPVPKASGTRLKADVMEPDETKAS